MNNMQYNKNFFAICLLAPFALNAESLSPKIVTVSGQKVMTESTTGKAMQEKLQREHKKASEPLEKAQQDLIKAETSLKSLQEDLQKEFTKFDSEAKTMSADARDKKQIELQDKALDFESKKRTFERDAAKLQADAQKIERKMSELYQTEMTKLDSTVKATIKEEAEKNNWDLVLMEESVMYANPRISKTDAIISKLDEKTKAINMAKQDAIKNANAKK